MTSGSPSEPLDVTGKLCNWIAGLRLDDIPVEVKERAAHLILDGIACALVGSHLPWSEIATNAMFDFEEEGSSCTVIGWDRKASPLCAALLNSTYIQGFELDDWHSRAPLHSNAIILPALFAAVEHLKHKNNRLVTGEEFLLATIIGYEVGPRVGLALHGGDILSRGWHSGVVFGHASAAAAVSSLLRLPPSKIEDALGTACTQACGLMSAQFESMAKRMQHGFAARNGLFAALMASKGYTGIQRVFERDYGGFLSVFSLGGDVPAKDEIIQGLGEDWETMNINIKPYPCMAGTHATIDCVRQIQDQQHSLDRKDIQSITIEMSKPSFEHGGWKPTRPLNAIGAQMNASYIAAVQFIDKDVTIEAFADSMLDRDEIWKLADVTTVRHQPDFDAKKEFKLSTRVTIILRSGEEMMASVVLPKGVKAPISNAEIVDKFEKLTHSILDTDQSACVKDVIFWLVDREDLTELLEIMGKTVGCVLG